MRRDWVPGGWGCGGLGSMHQELAVASSAFLRASYICEARVRTVLGTVSGWATCRSFLFEV